MITIWKDIAEEFKWIIFASKEYRNEVDINPVLSHIADFLKDFSLQFPIDKSKIISTGLSGGGMGSHAFAFYFPNLISAIVVNTGKMNDAFIDQKNEYPRRKIVVFLASPTDFRYAEMKRDRAFLENLGWQIKWIEFQGGHTFAPPDVYHEAAKWLKAQFDYRN